MRSVASNVLVGAAAAALAVGVGGCTNNYAGKINMRSVSAEQRLVLYRSRLDGSPIVCAEPNPGELQQATLLAIEGAETAPPSDDQTVAASDVRSNVDGTKTLETIGLHSTSIQLMREGHYRLCEGLINGAITEQQYQDSIKRIDASIAGYMAILFNDTTPTSHSVAATYTAPASSIVAATDTAPEIGDAEEEPAEELIAGPAREIVVAEAKSESRGYLWMPKLGGTAAADPMFSQISAGQLPVKTQWP